MAKKSAGNRSGLGEHEEEIRRRARTEHYEALAAAFAVGRDTMLAFMKARGIPRIAKAGRAR